MSHSEKEKFASSNNSDFRICRHCGQCFHANMTDAHKARHSLEDKTANGEDIFYPLQESEVTYYINKHKEIIRKWNELRILVSF